MKVLILLLVATCAIAYVRAGEDNQIQQDQPPQEQLQDSPQDLQETPPQGPPQGPSLELSEDRPGGPQEQPSEGSFQGPQDGSFQGPQDGSFQGPQDGSFQGPQDGSFEGPQDGSFQGPQDGSFQGPQDGSFKGPFPEPPKTLFQGPPQESFQGPPQGSFQGPPKGPQNGPGSKRPPPPPPIFNDFTTKELNAIINRILSEAGRFRERFGHKGIMDGMNGQCAVDHIRAMFASYNATLKTLQEKFASCVTDDMKALPEKATKYIFSCLPSPSDMEKKRKESKTAFDELIKKLKSTDEEVSGDTDDLQKQIKIAEVEWSEVFGFYFDKADNMFKSFQTIHSCMSSKRSAIQQQVTGYLKQLETCVKQ